MNTKEFGNTGMDITRIGFGAWAIGGGNWEFGWGPQEDDKACLNFIYLQETPANDTLKEP